MEGVNKACTLGTKCKHNEKKGMPSGHFFQEVVLWLQKCKGGISIFLSIVDPVLKIYDFWAPKTQSQVDL